MLRVTDPARIGQSCRVEGVLQDYSLYATTTSLLRTLATLYGLLLESAFGAPTAVRGNNGVKEP